MHRSDSNLVEIKVRLPKPLMDELNALFWDPVRQRPRYGARTKVIRAGLERYIKEQKDARAKQQRNHGGGDSSVLTGTVGTVGGDPSS